MKISHEILGFKQLHDLLKEGCRLALLVRHAERPELRDDDKDFGLHLGLTTRGIEEARAAGALFKEAPETLFFASPMTRTRLTARYLAEGMGLPDATVNDAEELGVRGFFYDDPYSVQEIMRQQGYMAYMLDYLNQGTAPHSRPLHVATGEMAEWLRRTSAARLNVFVSHDLFIAAFMTGLKVRTYTAEDWIDFLEGAALIQHPSGTWTCHACLPTRPS